MNDRMTGGPDGPDFRAWFDREVPADRVQIEKLAIVEHFNEVMAEPVHTTTLEEALVKAMEYDLQQAKKSAQYWADEATAEHNKREAVELMAAGFRRAVKFYVFLALALIIPLVGWLAVR